MNRRLLVLLIVVLAAPAAAAEPPITAVRFTPSGKQVLAVSQAGLLVFQWPDLKRVRTIRIAAPNLHDLAFSPDGKHVAVAGGFPAEEGLVEVLTWPAGKVAATFNQHDDSVRAVAWLNKSTLVTASMDRRLRTWNMDSDRTIATLNGHSRSVDAVCLLADNKTLVSAGVDQSLRVWDLESGKLLRSLNQHTGTIHSLAFRPAESGLPMVASAAADRTIRLWQPTIGRMVRYIRLDATPLSLAWLDQRRIAVACQDGRLRIIDADELKILDEQVAIQGWAYTLQVHPTDGSLVVAGSNGQIVRVVLAEDQ